MVPISEDVNKLFDVTLNKISTNVKQMMQDLWVNWSHLGLDENAKRNNITKLVDIEKELHQDVIGETWKRLKRMQRQVNRFHKKLKLSSMVNTNDKKILPTILVQESNESYDKKNILNQPPLTPEIGKERNNHSAITPKTSQLQTPTRLTRSAPKYLSTKSII